MAVVAVCEPVLARSSCPFRCLGCGARSSPEHETEALDEHLRLVLKAVVGLQSVVFSRREAASTALAAAEAFAASERTPSTSSTMPAGGQCDLLRLLEGTDHDDNMRARQAQPASPAPSSPPSPPPSPTTDGRRSPRRSAVPEQPRSVVVAVESSRDATPYPEDTAGRPVALVPTLPLPGVRPDGDAKQDGNRSPSRNRVDLQKPASPPRQAAEKSEPRVVSPTRGAAEAEAHRMLNSVTVDLQEGRISHEESVERFSQLIDTLPAGKLRCGALLNRAHCLVGLSRHSDALADIDAIIEERSPGVEASKWHKVWLSRGGIHRKLAQAAGGDCALYARARADYEHVLAIEPPHESSVSKARRGLQQLDELERNTSSTRASSSSAAARISEATAANRGEDIAGRMSVSPEKPSSARTSSAAPAGRDCEEEHPRTLSPRQRSPPKRNLPTSGGGQTSEVEADEEQKAKRCRPGLDASEADLGGTNRPHAALDIDMDFVHRNLITLGRDCAVAGRALFEEGAVHERHSVLTPSGGACETPPRAMRRRIFDIRSPLGGPAEVVELSCSASSRCGGGERRSSGVGDISRLGDCSCRLRGHCKHMAAVLVALEREVGCSAGGAAALGGGCAPARVGDSVARARRDTLEQRLERLTMEELKSYLRLNNQMLSGTKVELLRRVADGVVFGALPQCPNCNGHLHPEASADGDLSSFRCRKLNRDREPCGYEISAESVIRRPFIGADQLS